ncbi:unnamed protein product [Sphagnum troendelagicum]|uniref:Uncharacterized protein n=1 Tax=Sphagnum troendelagicum TaxID=128251 RepID=A0ABP0TAC8_9BRYO
MELLLWSCGAVAVKSEQELERPRAHDHASQQDPLWLLYGFYVFEILQTCLGHVQDPEVEAEQSHNSTKTGITKTYKRKREASVQIFSCLFLWISWSCMKFSW